MLNDKVFARCRDSVAQGRRLENLSWRLWNRETFCCESGDSLYQDQDQDDRYETTTRPRYIQRSRDSVTDDLPQLSGSLETVDDEALDFTSESAPMDILRPRIRRQDSCASSRSRGKERHITSDDLEKMVVSIIEAKVPLDAPLPNIPPSPLEHEKDSQSTAHTGSTTSEASIASSCNTSAIPSMEDLQPTQAAALPSPRGPVVTKGFSPPRGVCRITAPAPESSATNVIPRPNDEPAPRMVQPKKQGAKFEVGGSSEDSFSDRSIETRRQPIVQPKKPMFVMGRESSEAESSLKSALHPARQGSSLSAHKKTASFSKNVVTETYPSAFESDDDESDSEYIDESAIDDDDDDEEWEDSVEESGKSSTDELNFKRVDSKANLTSRPSLLTLMMAKNKQKLTNNASQSTSAIPRARPSLNGPSLVASPNESDDAPLTMKMRSRGPPMRPINEVPRSVAQPIHAVPTVIPTAALSPRTTRRNMLSTELTDSLRRNLLWERSQKTSTANAVKRRQQAQMAKVASNEGGLKRRHTSHDVANLQQHPETSHMDKKNNDALAQSFEFYNNNMDSSRVW